MKIAITGDIHMNHQALGRAMFRAHDAGCERIIFAGDFGYNFSEDFLRTAQGVYERTGLLIEWVDGNHEDFDYLESVDFDPLPGVIEYHKRGSVETIDGLKFMFLGGATSVDRPWRMEHTSWWPQEELTFSDIEKAKTQGEVDIVIAHDCPYLPPLSNKGSDSGFPAVELARSEFHRQKVREVYFAVQPKLWFHGHYHMRYSLTKDESWGTVQLEGLGYDADSVKQNQVIVDTEDIKTELILRG